MAPNESRRPRKATAAGSGRARAAHDKKPARKKPAAQKSATKKPATKRSARKKPANAGSSRSVLWRWRRGLFGLGLLVVAAFAGAGFVLAQVELPPEDPLLQSTFICAADVPLGGCGPDNAMAKPTGSEDRVSIPLGEMPQVFIDAVLAAEDRSFYRHSGIDPIGITRALYRDIRNEGVRQGGSTITQQYVKNAYLTSERSLSRKLKEAVLAVKLERELSKDEILERYLNTVYFGRGAYGAEAAARAYFGRSIRVVDVNQAAYLAGLIRAPESADASRDLDVATFRRDSVLAGMLDIGAITREEHDEAKAVPLTDLVDTRTTRDALGVTLGAEYGTEYFVDHVVQVLIERYGEDIVFGGGLRVYTSLDPTLQRHAYEAITSTLDRDDDPAASLVSIDERGHVVAMVGGTNFTDNKVNLALGRAGGGSGRQPGSAFKPIVLATALDQGASVYSKFLAPAELTLPRANAGRDWKVRNYANDDQGLLDMVEATRVSSNTAYAQLMLEVGAENVVDLAGRLGIRSDLEPVNSLVLGAEEVSVLDMANAYATFSRRGRAIDPIVITRVEQVVDGKVVILQNASTKVTQAMDADDVDDLTWVLRKVVNGGTGANANISGLSMAGKTGTTQDFRDAWFVGYTPKMSTAVWMGFPDPDENGDPILMRGVRGRNVTGGSFPAVIWRDYMLEATRGKDSGTFNTPTLGGSIINADLTTTTTRPPLCGPAPDPDADGAVPTTEPCRTTTTLPPCEGSEVATDDDGDATCRTTTTTTDPDETTTTTTEPDSSSTSSSSTTAPGSSTTAPGSSSSTSSSSTTTTTDPDGEFDVGD